MKSCSKGSQDIVNIRGAPILEGNAARVENDGVAPTFTALCLRSGASVDVDVRLYPSVVLDM